jgi:hypothetical protein
VIEKRLGGVQRVTDDPGGAETNGLRSRKMRLLCLVRSPRLLAGTMDPGSNTKPRSRAPDRVAKYCRTLLVMLSTAGMTYAIDYWSIATSGGSGSN